MDIHTLHILTDEQLVKMAQEGSETAEEILIEKYKSLVKNKAKTYYIAGADNEDVVQEGMIGIFKAIRSYDANKEAAFKTYADTCINNQILSAIKKANRRKHQPLNESIPLTVERVDSEWGETNTEEAGFVKGTMESFCGKSRRCCRRKTAGCSAILKGRCGQSALKVMRTPKLPRISANHQNPSITRCSGFAKKSSLIWKNRENLKKRMTSGRINA